MLTAYRGNRAGLFIRKTVLPAIAGLLFLSALAADTAQAQGAQQPASQPKLPIEGTNGQWLVEGTERQADARVAEFQGRSALWLKNNSHVMQAGTEEFVDGTIEFDVAPMERGDFIAIVFRRESPQNHENIYLRPFSSGLFEALQYAPRINGSASWQLYPEFNAAVDLPRNQWTHLRLEIKGSSLTVYVNNAAKPALSVARLRGIPAKGPVGFWARANNDPKTWAAALSNVTIRPAASADKIATARPAPAVGTITAWEVAAPVKAEAGAVTRLPQLSGWRQAEVEESGLVNLNRVLGRHNGRGTAFARTTIKAEQAHTLSLEIGYSDDVTVFVNGEPVYAGLNGWESRHPGYLGFVKTGYETVHLRLRQGDNEIILAVTDDQRFGWGFAARTVSP
ncbi:MAG: hypothetical protein SF097_09110 [Acidobacteriota bacterium]|nr:hypothetical protein [Acidobacteriota bacterium]